MKNPLRKRYIRELKEDFGKYLVIFLFMVMLISLVSGYLVVAESIKKTYYEGYDKYNIEDGHITFNMEPTADILEEIENKEDLTFYDLSYAEELLDGTAKNVRIYKDRDIVDLECVYEGTMPEGDNEIAMNRLFATNNNISVGDDIVLNGKTFTVTGIVALPDYSCSFEKAQDMMFNSIDFGQGIVTDEGFDYLNSPHFYYNYAWQYNEAPADEFEENERSEDLMDTLEDVIKDYDTAIVQAKVDDLYTRANELSDTLEDQFDDASDVIEDKTTAAAKVAGTKAVAALSAEEKMALYMQGADNETYIKAAAKKQGTTVQGLVAEELGCSEQSLKDLQDATEDMENTFDSVDIDSEPPVVSLDAEDDSYENEMDFSLDDIRDIVAKIDATELYDVTEINETLDQLDAILNYEFNEDDYLTVDSYAAKYENQAITYCMDDMSGDEPMYIVFDYLVILILAFVFAITISNTLVKEAGVIGTLRASGYTRGEMIRHYMFIPTVVFIVAAIVGNILGYTCMTSFYIKIFFNSFDLACYESYFNEFAFVITTVVPLIIMMAINFIVLVTKMKLSPMQFLRRQLKTKVKRRAMLLNKKWPFTLRFRLRILFQNIPSYITLCIGIIFGGVVAVFGCMFGPLLADYSDLIKDSAICQYQYVLKDQIDTATSGAEKYCITTLDTEDSDYLTDEISIYGIEPNSKYVLTAIPEGEVLVTNGMAAKYGLDIGDTVTLKEQYNDTTYDFVIADIYTYDGTLGVFMNRKEFNNEFDKEDDYFTGYFSNEEITDIDSDDVVTIVTSEDLTAIADQLLKSMGSIMSLLEYFGVVMFLLLMYLMTKQIIERNMQSIAMTKILGYRDGEIAGLYLVLTSAVVIVSLLVSIPIIDAILRYAFEYYLYKEITGYVPYVIDKMCFVKEILYGIVSYLIICIFMMHKINKIPKSEALKNQE